MSDPRKGSTGSMYPDAMVSLSVDQSTTPGSSADEPKEVQPGLLDDGFCM